LRAAFLTARRVVARREEREEEEREEDVRRDEEVRARLATARLRPFVLFFARRLSLRRARFAMFRIPFKFLTGLS
jgi:hypothetical protein